VQLFCFLAEETTTNEFIDKALNGGTTLVMVSFDAEKGALHVLNVGDSEARLVLKDEKGELFWVTLSEAHTPELARLNLAVNDGGIVSRMPSFSKGLGHRKLMVGASFGDCLYSNSKDADFFSYSFNSKGISLRGARRLHFEGESSVDYGVSEEWISGTPVGVLVGTDGVFGKMPHQKQVVVRNGSACFQVGRDVDKKVVLSLDPKQLCRENEKCVDKGDDLTLGYCSLKGRQTMMALDGHAVNGAWVADRVMREIFKLIGN